LPSHISFFAFTYFFLCLSLIESDLMANDKKQQPISMPTFDDLDLPKSTPERVNSLPRKLQFVQASSELSARIVTEDLLESSVEEGVDISLSSSQNSKPGHELMSQHLKKKAEVGGHSDSSSSPFKWSKESSVFFQPISTSGEVGPGKGEQEEEEEGNWQTDEEKSRNLARPMPSIFLNDSEMRLSPLPPAKSDDESAQAADDEKLDDSKQPASRLSRCRWESWLIDSKFHSCSVLWGFVFVLVGKIPGVAPSGSQIQ